MNDISPQDRQRLAQLLLGEGMTPVRVPNYFPTSFQQQQAAQQGRSSSNTPSLNQFTNGNGTGGAEPYGPPASAAGDIDAEIADWSGYGGGAGSATGAEGAAGAGGAGGGGLLESLGLGGGTAGGGSGLFGMGF